MISTGSIDAMAAIMRKGMTGARLRIMVLPMARKASGENEEIDRLRPSHGPQNTPATKAHKKMLTNCHTLTFMTASLRFLSDFCQPVSILDLRVQIGTYERRRTSGD